MEIFIYLTGFFVALFAIYSSLKNDYSQQRKIENNISNFCQILNQEIFQDKRDWFIDRFMKNEKQLIRVQKNFKKEMILNSHDYFLDKKAKIKKDISSIN